MMNMRIYKGFTLVEALVALAILAVLAMIAIPAWNEFIKKKRLTTSIESVYDALKIAHSESIKRKANVTVSFTNGAGGTSWCFALSDTGDCNCKTGVCAVDGITNVIDGANGVVLTITDFTNNKYVTFEGIRGSASNSGSITVTDEPYSITLSVNKIGLIRTCSNNVVGYSVCN